MLLQLGMPSFNTVIHNARMSFKDRLYRSRNAILDAIHLVRSRTV